MSKRQPNTAIFIMPATSSAWKGAEGLWVTTAGWAAAAKKKFGNSIVITQDRIASCEDVLDYPLLPFNEKGRSINRRKKKEYSLIPNFLKIFGRDLLSWMDSHKWEIFRKINYKEEEVAFVWEKHDLFSGRGLKLARRLKVPYISYVHAPVVWEASKWGVKRYFWGRLLEKREAAVLKKSDLVAVVSEEVKEKLIKMGVTEDKIQISPMAVDPEFFATSAAEAREFRKELDLQGQSVIGWIGSFRKFHGLDQLIIGFEKVLENNPDSKLLLIGDGAERKNIEKLVEDLRLTEKVIFTGKIPFRNISRYISVFDVAVVSAKSAENFHYSPQKLREYMAAGKAVLAPDAGEVPLLFQDGTHLKLFGVGDVESIRNGIEFLLDNESQRKEISEAGKKYILCTGTWDKELEKCLGTINKN